MACASSHLPRGCGSLEGKWWKHEGLCGYENPGLCIYTLTHFLGGLYQIQISDVVGFSSCASSMPVEHLKNETHDKTKHSQPIIKQWSSGGFLLGKLPGGQPGKWNIPRFCIIVVPHTWWFASWPNLIPYSWRSLRSKGRVKETLRYQSHKQRVPNTTATLWKRMWLKHFRSMFVNLRSFKVENNTSILENHDTLPMFGTILRQKIAMLLHQSQSTRCTTKRKQHVFI